MGYRLGVDCGTTHTAAAVLLSGRAEVLRLASRRAEVPSLVFVPADGPVLVGEPAERRGQNEPARLAREFKRRVGDPVPMLVGGAPYSAHALTARVLEFVLRTVTAHQGGPPEHVVLTCPANWGPYKRELLEQAARLADLPPVTLRTEPEAAAIEFAAGERMADGDIIAVYDLGGGTFDAAVLRRTATGFDILGTPEGIEQLGGMDFDEAVFDHVVQTLPPEKLAEPDLAALARLRRDCVEAKEALSDDTEVMIPVALPALHTRVRLTRAEFEDMIRPALTETVGAMRRALRSAGVRPEQLRTILLSGGSSRIPLVSQLLSTEFERPVVLDPHPEHSIALGAARAGAPPVSAAPSPAPPPVPTPPVPAPPVPTRPEPAPPTTAVARTAAFQAVPPTAAAGPAEPDTTVSMTAGPPPPAGPPPGGFSPGVAAVPPAGTPAELKPPRPRRTLGRRAQIALAAVAVLVIAGAGTFLVLRQTGQGNDRDGAAAPPAPASAAVSSAPVAAADCTFIDRFDSATVDSSWERTRPDEDITIVNSRAVITAQDGADIYSDRSNAPMLLREANGDFVLETTVLADAKQFYQGAGLVLWVDEQHYVRLELGYGDTRSVVFEYRDGGEHIKVIPPNRADPKAVAAKSPDAVLQLVRQGGTVTARWRPSGDDQISDLATVNLALPDVLKAGISVLNRAQKGAKPTAFQATFYRAALTC